MTYTIGDFNELKKIDGFRFIELEPYERHNGEISRTFVLQEWCPEIQKWVRCLRDNGCMLQSVRSLDEKMEDMELGEGRLNALIELIHARHVVLEGSKYDSRYYFAETTEDIGKVAYKIFVERFENSYYLSDEVAVPEQLDLPCELQEAFLDAANKIIEEGNRERQDALERNREAQEVNALLGTKDYVGVVNFLKGRNDYEYEGFDIRVMETVE